MKIILGLALLTIGFEVAYGGKLPKSLNKTKGQGGLERNNENWLGFNNSTKWVMRKVRKMIKAFDILEEQFVNLNETMVAGMADMADMNNTLVSQLVSASADIASNTADIASLVTDTATNNASIASLVQDTSNNTAYLASHSSAIGTLKIDVNTNEAGIATNLANIASNDVDIVSLKTNGSGSVWFDAVRTSDFTASTWTTITYSNVEESNAGAMDVGTGVFTAPLAGTYQFIIQVNADYTAYGAVKIVVDGTTVSFIYDSDSSHYTTITGTAVVEMQPGQKVWAETHYKVGSSSDGYIHFTGVLITPK